MPLVTDRNENLLCPLNEFYELCAFTPEGHCNRMFAIGVFVIDEVPDNRV